VRKAELHLQILALHRGAEADPVDLKFLLEAFGYARDQIVHQRPRRAPMRARAVGLDLRVDLHARAFDLGANVVMQLHLQRALRALDRDRLALNAGGDAGGERNRLLADTRHDSFPSLRL
jgi:hypothetical protein